MKLKHAEGGSLPRPSLRDRSPSLNGSSTETQTDLAMRREWIASVFDPFGTRRHVEAGARLFAIGDRAAKFYLVEKGRLVVQRHTDRGDLARRNACEGDVIIYDCDGAHVADCRAVRDSVVITIDRRILEFRAMLDPAIKGLLHQVHARELDLILESLGVRDDTPRQCLRERPAQAQRRWKQLAAKGRWRPYLAHDRSSL